MVEHFNSAFHAKFEKADSDAIPPFSRELTIDDLWPSGHMPKFPNPTGFDLDSVAKELRQGTLGPESREKIKAYLGEQNRDLGEPKGFEALAKLFSVVSKQAFSGANPEEYKKAAGLNVYVIKEPDNANRHIYALLSRNDADDTANKAIIEQIKSGTYSPQVNLPTIFEVGVVPVKKTESTPT
jgi:hypothetical protein